MGGIVILAVLLTSNMRGVSGDPAEIKESTSEGTIQLGVAIRPEEDIGVFEAAPDAENCLSEGLLETHPIMADEAKRLDPFLINSESMAVYRDLAEAELLDLAAQNDSGAMAVLAAMHVMRARGLPESKAVPYLLLEDSDLLSYRYSLPFTNEQTRHRELAADWFYKSALHGRVMALINVGHQLDMMGRKPVDLGWISAEDYDLLTRAQKSTFNAANVYQAVAYTIAPDLEIGLFDEDDGGFGTLFAKRYASIAEPIAAEFRSDRRDLGLAPLTVPASELPPLRELTALLCSPTSE